MFDTTFNTTFDTAFTSPSYDFYDIIPGNLVPSSYDLSNYNSSSSNNGVGNNLLSISNTGSNTVEMAAPTGMVEVYNMTYDTIVPITYKATSSVARMATSNESRSAIYNEDSSADNDAVFSATGENDIDSYFDTVFDTVTTKTTTTYASPTYNFNFTTTYMYDVLYDTMITLKTYNTVYNLYFDTVFDGRTSNNDNYGDITVSNSIIVALKTHNTIHNLHFDTMIATIVAIVTTVSDNNTNATDVAISVSLINSPFYIIAHGSLVYLILLKIRFYDQQDSLLLLENNNNTALKCLIVVNNGISSAISANEASYDYDYGDTAVLIGSHSIIVSVADKATFSVVMMKSYGQSNVFYFDTTFTSASHASPSYYNDSSSSTVPGITSPSSYDLSNNNPSSSNEMNAPVVMVISYDMTFDTTVPVTYEATSSIARETTSNELPSSAVTFHNGITFAVNDEICPTSAGEAPYGYYYGDTAASKALPSIVIDTESSTVSVANN